MVPPPTSSNQPQSYSQSQSQSRSGTFSPATPASSLQTQIGAAASSGTGSPTAGTSSAAKITVTLVYLLLTQLKETRDRAKWDLQAEQLQKHIHDNGMEVFSKYFSRLVTQNASTIFPGAKGQAGGQSGQVDGSYEILVREMALMSKDIHQVDMIAESIETGTEELFRDFDLSTFMDHFKLDPLEKTVLAMAFKFRQRSDLKAKADAIISNNFPKFVNILSLKRNRRDTDADTESEHMGGQEDEDGRIYEDLSDDFIAQIVDRYVQSHPPNFHAAPKAELSHKVKSRWSMPDNAPPMKVLAALDLIRVLGEKAPNALALYIQKTGSSFTSDVESCVEHLQRRPPNAQLTADQISSALTYTTISLTQSYNPSIFVSALRRLLPPTFDWRGVVGYFDQRDIRVTPEQFLSLYNALVPIVLEQEQEGDREGEIPKFDITCLWGGSHWENPETQLAFIYALTSLTSDQLDANTIPGLQATFSLDEYDDAPEESRSRAAVAVRQPLVSTAAMTAIFQVALHSHHASQSIEAKRLFQGVVIPNLDIFIVSAMGVSQPWPDMAVETLASLFDNFMLQSQQHEAFVLDSIWRKNKGWVIQRLVALHGARPIELPRLYQQIVKYNWLDELAYLPNGFGYDLISFAHGEGVLDLQEWTRHNAERGPDISPSLLQFLLIKSSMELEYQRLQAEATSAQASEVNPHLIQKHTTTLQIKTVAALLQALEDFMPKEPLLALIQVQRACMGAYPRLINWGEGYDNIIEANVRQHGHGLPAQAVERMEAHYKTMYGNETQVKEIVDTLGRYKHSRDMTEQDVFTCMIHGLFDEYNHYVGYPLEALATTAVLFGGIISHKLISDLSLKIGMGMILQSVRDYRPEDAMYKFGLQALMQLFTRFREWPGFCKQLIQIPGLRGTEAWKRANEVVRDVDDEAALDQNGIAAHPAVETLVNGMDDAPEAVETRVVPFTSVNADPPPHHMPFEDPTVDLQDKIQFGLNNLTPAKLHSTFNDLQGLLRERHQQWFAAHLVEERAKMQPNYHQVYLDFVRLFQDKGLAAEVLRQSYVSAARMLNAESTMQNSTERTHLKHLGAWLGLMTLARDRPIKHRNIAFKQLLIEAHDTKRLVMVIPFVCKVLVQGAKSTVYRPPNPWLMDILYLLIELYHHAELKLNLKFEIEVLCKDLSVDHNTIEPSQELMNRASIEDMGEMAVPEGLEPFDNLSLNGLAGAVASGLSPHTMPVAIPDIGPQLQIPPANEMVVTSTRLHEMVRTAISRALHDIIQPVVDRSVTIAAISTQQMIKKDFATEFDETRIRSAAHKMVKTTAGSLALVTSKEPLRNSIINYLRHLSSELPTGLPEGTIIMCVNSNLDLACDVIEKSAQDRAVPEIDEMLEMEMELRRRHRVQRPNDAYVDPHLSRWAMTIPNPFKLSPNVNGLTPEQLAIYEDFARQPRTAAPNSAQTHVSSTSDATRNIADQVLQDGFGAVPNIPTPAETSAVGHLQAPVPYASHSHQGMTNGRSTAHPSQVDARNLVAQVQNILSEMQRVALESSEEHFSDLPRAHPLMEGVDTLTQCIIRIQGTEEYGIYTAEQICSLLINQTHQLFLESLVHVLGQLLRITAGNGTNLRERVVAMLMAAPAHVFAKPALIAALLPTDLVPQRFLDEALFKNLIDREENAILSLETALDLAIFTETPVLLLADFAKSLEAAWARIQAEPEDETCQRLKGKLLEVGAAPQRAGMTDDAARLERYEYFFEEWTHLYSSVAGDDILIAAAKMCCQSDLFNSKNEFITFIRFAFDAVAQQFGKVAQGGGNIVDVHASIDALVKLIAVFSKENLFKLTDPATVSRDLFATCFSLGCALANHYCNIKGDQFCQQVFFRYFSSLLHGATTCFEELENGPVQTIPGAVEAQYHGFLLDAAHELLSIQPLVVPGMGFAWLDVWSHRQLLPELMNIPEQRGWPVLIKLIQTTIRYVAELMKAIDLHEVTREFYRGLTKLMLVLHHDYPEFLDATHLELCAWLPLHATQIRNMILNATPRQEADRQNSVPGSTNMAVTFAYLQDKEMLGIVDQVLQNGPSEDAVAYLTHAINNKSDTKLTGFGRVPHTVDLFLVQSLVTYIGDFAVRRAKQGGELFIPAAPDAATVTLLAHELGPEAKYYLLNSLVDKLRYPSEATSYFTSVLLKLWGDDLHDPEELDLRQQMLRVILERFTGHWPQPFGLVRIIITLSSKSEYMFFEQPFIKMDREIESRFMQIVQSAPAL